MTATVLVAGKLFKTPERKTSSAGKAFVSATIREGGGEAVTWWKALAFDEESAADMLRLAEGETIAVCGSFKADAYEKNGAHRVSFTVFVDRVMSARRKPKAQ